MPDNELLSRIAEEEETKFREMEKAVKPLRDNLDRLREIHFSLSAGPASVDANLLTSFIARCDTLIDVLKTSHQDVKGVSSTYEKIVKEMRVNQLSEDIQTKVYRTIYMPLAEVSETCEIRADHRRGRSTLTASRWTTARKRVPGRVDAAQPARRRCAQAAQRPGQPAQRDPGSDGRSGEDQRPDPRTVAASKGRRRIWRRPSRRSTVSCSRNC